MIFRPERIEKSAVIQIKGPVEKVFPLFGPIREKEWAEGWEPEIIYGDSSRIEEHMIFRSHGHHANAEGYTWVISQLDVKNNLIEYTVSTRDRIWFIRVQCEAAGDLTAATITYTYTGLTEQGNEMNREALKSMYQHDLKDWENAINHYLQTGQQLRAQQ